MTNLRCECNTDRQLKLLQGDFDPSATLSGIDFAEATYQEENAAITIHFIGTPPALSERNFLVRDLRRGDTLPVTGIDQDQTIVAIQVADAVTHNIYRVRIVGLEDGRQTQNAPDGIDPRLNEVDIQFFTDESKHTEADPLPRPNSKNLVAGHESNYLARDFQSYLRILYDRLSQTMPDWTERRAADGYVNVLESMAYLADRLSYFQDAVATEAYLQTARQRISLRRHARLLDYRLDEGCNARAFVHVQVARDVGFDPNDIFFITEPPAAAQLSGPAFSAAQIPEELFPELVVYEPIVPRFAASEESFRCLLRIEEIKDDIGLATSVLTSKAAIAQSVRARLSQEAVRRLETEVERPVASISEVTRHRLVTALNEVIRHDEFADDAQGMAGPSSASSIRKNRATVDQVFESSISRCVLDQRVRLFANHNEIEIYTWGEAECVLVRGATSATLRNPPVGGATVNLSDDSESAIAARKLDQLNVGDYLLFEEVKGAGTGAAADADRTRRQVVRVTEIANAVDPMTGERVLKVRWSDADALEDDFVVSARRGVPYCDHIDGITVVRGNVITVDHGRSIYNEELGSVAGRWNQTGCETDWSEPAWSQERVPFRPVLREPALTHSRILQPDRSAKRFLTPHDGELDPPTTPTIRLLGIPAMPAADPPAALPLSAEDLESATGLIRILRSWRENPERMSFFYVLQDALPPNLGKLLEQLETVDASEAADVLTALKSSTTWEPAFDSVGSRPDEQKFVVEMDNQRFAHLRFADDHHPDVGTRFYASYRVGNGVAGNVGSDQITVIVTKGPGASAVAAVRNPIPASGGRPPEPMARAKLLAPSQYQRIQFRAVLPSDYAELVKRDFASQVQNATARMQWRGTHWLVEVAIDPLSVVREFDLLSRQIESKLQRYRRMGHRVRIVRGIQVPLDLHLTVDVQVDYPRGDVRLAIIDLFSNRVQANGEPGIFHPDRLTFGQSVYVSEIVRVASKLPGVENVVVTRLARLRGGLNVAAQLDTKRTSEEDRSNAIHLSPLEIAQLDNTDSEDTGRLRLSLRGGK